MSGRPTGVVETTTGAGWQEGDPVGRRRFTDTGGQQLSGGGHLPAVRLAYETWGTPSYDATGVSNAVLILHALTGDSHVAGPAAPGHPTHGWWDELVGPGRCLDTDRWFVVAPNALGGCQGTTGPSSAAPDGQPWGSRWPEVSIRDMVESERRLADTLDVRRWALVVGGSMGGFRALEWAVTHPDRVARLAVLATAAAASAYQIGIQTTQIRAITSDPHWYGGDYHRAPLGPLDGLGAARRIAQLTYRTPEELEARFSREVQPSPTPPGPEHRYAIQSYLDHHADALTRRFDPGSYVSLTQAMNRHDIGAGRQGVEAAMRRVTARTLVVGIDSDRLYPPSQQEELAAGLPNARPLQILSSRNGHDAFLTETAAVSQAVGALLDPADQRTRP